MLIEIAGMNLEIPDDLVEERMKVMYVDTMEDNIAQIKRDGEGFYKCFKPGELNSVEEFNQKMIERIDDIVDWFRPENNPKIFVFNPICGFENFKDMMREEHEEK